MMPGQPGQMTSPLQDLRQELGGPQGGSGMPGQAQLVHHEGNPEFQEFQAYIDGLEQQIDARGYGDPGTKQLLQLLKSALSKKAGIEKTHRHLGNQAAIEAQKHQGMKAQSGVSGLDQTGMPFAAPMPSQ